MNYESRIAKLEASMVPASQIAFAFAHLDIEGRYTAINCKGRHFDRLPQESVADLKARAYAELGPNDDVVCVTWGQPSEQAAEASP
jgi:hypothetical protein